MKKIFYIFLILIFQGIYAQNQEKVIDIRDFKGVFTNADLEDIPQENFTVLKNFRAFNGKLVKTFGFGSPTSPHFAIGVGPIWNLDTYVNSNLDNGYIYIVKAVTWVGLAHHIVELQYSTDLNIWADLFGLVVNETDYYFDYYSYGHPVIQEGGAIRFLPTNISERDIGYEPKGIYINYIDRDYFDEIYSPAAAFYAYECDIVKPEIDFSVSKFYKGDFDETKYYKFSYTYDGNQESLLDNGIAVNYDSSFGKFDFYIDKDEHNKRITALNVYRADDYSEDIYEKIHTIDFLRDSATTFSGDSCWNGRYYAYVPELIDYDFDNTNLYRITLRILTMSSRRTLYIKPSTGTGQSVFKIDTVKTYAGAYLNTLEEDYYNVKWELWEGTPAWTRVDLDDKGAFAGLNTAILDTNLSIYGMAGGVLCQNITTDSIEYRLIESNYKAALLFSGDSLRNDTARSWEACSPAYGNYFVTDNGDSVLIEFFDSDLIAGDDHPLLGEVSININSKFAKIIGARLWKANLMLDPYDNEIFTGTAAMEKHNDWLSYSELGQYDVNPVSNIISMADAGIGEITGLDELFGNPVVMKKNAISIININLEAYFDALTSWNIISSNYNIGNIAPRGYISVLGNVYVCYYDGIYKLSPNMLAASSQTPVELLKITTPIEDIYLNLTLHQKENIISEYDQSKSEIIWKFGSEIWAYNVFNGDWREIETSRDIKIMALDENANVMVYDSSVNKIYCEPDSEDVSCEVKLKTFSISDDRQEQVNRLYLTYKSEVLLKVYLYKENSTTASATFDFPVSDVITTEKIFIDEYTKKFTFSIFQPTLAASKGNVEIHRIKIKYEEGEQ